MDKIFSVETFDKYKKEIAHSPFRVFTAKELEEDPLVNSPTASGSTNFMTSLQYNHQVII
jgi:hypothetical protein